MKKRVIVISLGGSLIVPKGVDYKFLHKFKKAISKHYGKYKFVIVCGGGSTARKIMTGLKKQGKSEKEQANAGIRATRMNAKLMMQFFGKEASSKIPKNMKEIKADLKKNKVVFCGALKYAKNETSDGTAAKLANYLKTDFINITNIRGLYDKNPKTHKNVKFIPYITWEKFEKMALKLKYKLGQHFILDQNTSTIIRKYKIRTYVIGKNIANLNKILKGKKFIGTTIEN
ncbi:MAG: UMP kinase [Nanoarchaeota archaeon]|nr:UMP kinase [Nanoarchaeota archaeon]